jgi:hypothetical protein
MRGLGWRIGTIAFGVLAIAEIIWGSANTSRDWLTLALVCGIGAEVTE